MEYLTTDMVNYNGIVCEYGAIKHHAPADEIIVANEEEIAWYKYCNKIDK